MKQGQDTQARRNLRTAVQCACGFSTAFITAAGVVDPTGVPSPWLAVPLSLASIWSSCWLLTDWLDRRG